MLETILNQKSKIAQHFWAALQATTENLIDGFASTNVLWITYRRRFDLLLGRSRFDNCKPDKPHYSSQNNGSRRRKFEPHAPNEARRSNYNPPRLLSKGRAALIGLVDVPNLPKPVYCGVYKTYCWCVDTTKTRNNRLMPPEALP